jgi:hypothetical protein
MLRRAISLSLTVATRAASVLLQRETSFPGPTLSYQWQKAGAQQRQSGTALPVVVFNPLPFARCELLRLPIDTDDASVTDEQGSNVLAYTVSNRSMQQFTASGTGLCMFHACIPPLGLTTFFLHPNEPSRTSASDESMKLPMSPGVELHGVCVRAQVHRKSGLLDGLTVGCPGQLSESVDVRLNLLAYKGNGGAYVMRVDGSPEPLGAEPTSLRVRRTSLAEEASVESPKQYAVTTRVHGAKSTSLAMRTLRVVELELSFYAPKDREVVLRLQTSSLQQDAGLFVHDGCALSVCLQRTL